MDIFAKEPEDWKDLQVKVGKLFSDMDFFVEIEKDIKTVRETVNVDVYAKDTSFPSQIILVECKNWEAAVPKTIVHSFRTVVTDFGANAGYIVSKKGFQRGAFDAAKNSNVHLLSFNQLQDAFKLPYINAMVMKLQKVGYPLRRYSDWIESAFDKEIDKLSEEKKRELDTLRLQYNDISLSSVNIGFYKHIITGELDLESVDATIDRLAEDLPGIKFNCYSSYFDYLITLFDKGLKEFDNLFGKQLRKT